jgi:hypothetical protein
VPKSTSKYVNIAIPAELYQALKVHVPTRAVSVSAYAATWLRLADLVDTARGSSARFEEFADALAEAGGVLVSRRGIKTVNLPTAVCDVLDHLIREGRTSALSRDELVRAAVGLYLMAITGPTPGATSLEVIRQEIERFRARGSL